MNPDISSFEKVITFNMGYVKEESILVLTDTELVKIGEIFFRASERLSEKHAMMIMPPGRGHGSEPMQMVSEAMKHADLILMPTSKSLSHTSARRNATERGARIGSMPGISMQILRRMFGTDYADMENLTKKIASILRSTSKVRIKTGLGTDITMSIRGRTVHEDIGILKNKCDFGNLPAGETDLSPEEGTAEGILYIDGSALSSRINLPIKVIVKKGFGTKFEGDELAEKLESTLKKHGKNGFNIAELGIGTNRSARITGNILEDEKVRGTCHIAFGNNKSYGGKVDVPVHLDCIIREPTIYCDDRMVICRGKLL